MNEDSIDMAHENILAIVAVILLVLFAGWMIVAP